MRPPPSSSWKAKSPSRACRGRTLEERELARQTALTGLRREIAVGLEQADRGELFDGEEVFRDLEERLAFRNTL